MSDDTNNALPDVRIGQAWRNNDKRDVLYGTMRVNGFTTNKAGEQQAILTDTHDPTHMIKVLVRRMRPTSNGWVKVGASPDEQAEHNRTYMVEATGTGRATMTFLPRTGA